MGNKVEHVNFKDEINHKVMLRRLADDDELEGCLVVCTWKGGEVSTGWSNMKPSTAAIGCLNLQESILRRHNGDYDD